MGKNFLIYLFQAPPPPPSKNPRRTSQNQEIQIQKIGGNPICFEFLEFQKKINQKEKSKIAQKKANEKKKNPEKRLPPAAKNKSLEKRKPENLLEGEKKSVLNYPKKRKKLLTKIIEKPGKKF